RLLIAVALKDKPFTYAGSGIAHWPANDADRLKKAPLGPLMYSWPNRGLITKSKPSRWAAVSSSRNDFAKHEVICLHVPRKNFESRGGNELLRHRINRIPGTFVFGSETHAHPSFLCSIVFWLWRRRGMMLLVCGGVSL